jgi:hypothetical protein
MSALQAASYPAPNGQQVEPEFFRQMEYFGQMDAKRQELFCVRACLIARLWPHVLTVKQALYEENRRLRTELNNKTTDYDNEVQSRRHWQEKASSLDQQLHAASSIRVRLLAFLAVQHLLTQ